MILPIVAETVPEQSKKVSRDQSSQNLLDNFDNVDYETIVGNLVVSTLWLVQLLSEWKKHIVLDEVCGNSE